MITNYKDNNLVDLGQKLIPKTFLIDIYPNIARAFKFSGLWTWGHNIYGQLGENTRSNKSSPVQTIAGGYEWNSVSHNIYNSAAIKSDGTLWTWGDNSSGQLGDNTKTSKSSPVQIAGGGSNWVVVSLGAFHSTAVKSDGTLWTWGANDEYQLGTDAISEASSPVQTAAGGTDWKLVAAGGYHTTAIKTNGTLWCWGRNDYGQLGDNSRVAKFSPVQVTGDGIDWKSVTAGRNHTLAIKNNGSMWAWGLNSAGNLGIGTVTNMSTPTQVAGGGTNWSIVSAGRDHTTAIKTDNSLWVWGNNFFGQLGASDTSPRSSPIQTVESGTDWKLVAAGAYHTTAIKTNGTLWCWGRNDYGQLGDNSRVAKSSPVQVTGGGTTWKRIASGSVAMHTVAIKDEYENLI